MIRYIRIHLCTCCTSMNTLAYGPIYYTSFHAKKYACFNNSRNSLLVICLSRSPSGCESLRWGVSHTGSSSPVVSTLYVHWCEVQTDEVVWDGVYPSLPLPAPIPTSIHFSFKDTLDAVVIFSSLDMSVPSQSWLTYLVCNATDSNDTANVIISFPVLRCDTKHLSEHSHFSSFKKPLFTSSQGTRFCSINHHWPYRLTILTIC